MIKTVIIDDEIHCVKSLMWDIDQAGLAISVAGTAGSAEEGIRLIEQMKPALVFLDISMPGMNGFEMLEALPEIRFKIIFTTAYDHYAARAFRKSAVDFLVKPIDRNDLTEAVLKVTANIKSNSHEEHTLQNLLQNYNQPEMHQRIALPMRDGYEFVTPEQIIYLEAEGSYTKIHLQENRQLLVSRSIGDIAEMLPAVVFVRIHHSSIVNMTYITHFLRTDGGYVQLKNGLKLMVSKSRKNELMDRLGLK